MTHGKQGKLRTPASQLFGRFRAVEVVVCGVTMTAPVTHLRPVSPARGVILEHSVVRLHRALPEEGLKAGDLGAVVHVYEGGAGYEVEFLSGRSRPCLVTLTAEDVEEVEGK